MLEIQIVLLTLIEFFKIVAIEKLPFFPQCEFVDLVSLASQLS